MAKKLHPAIYALAVPLCGIIIATAYFIPGILKKTGDANPFPYAAYRESRGSLQGNEYEFDCQIDRLLAYDENKGRLLAVTLAKGTGARVPVFVPTTLRQNFETGQRYRLNIRVRADVLFVEDAEKL